MKIKIVPFDAAEFLDNPESRKHLAEDALKSGDPDYIAHAANVLAKAGKRKIKSDS